MIYIVDGLINYLGFLQTEGWPSDCQLSQRTIAIPSALTCIDCGGTKLLLVAWEVSRGHTWGSVMAML